MQIYFQKNCGKRHPRKWTISKLIHRVRQMFYLHISSSQQTTQISLNIIYRIFIALANQRSYPKMQKLKICSKDLEKFYCRNRKSLWHSFYGVWPSYHVNEIKMVYEYKYRNSFTKSHCFPTCLKFGFTCWERQEIE